MRLSTPLLALHAAFLTTAYDILTPQNVTFNSSYTLPSPLIARLNLSSAVAHNVETATRFERSNWATGSVVTDPFYTDLPTNASTAPAGSLLKLEVFTNTSTYTIPSTLALSRIVYQSKTLDGGLAPVSAYILWPYHPRRGRKTVPLVSWGHGTSGSTVECAPSHIRNLWDNFKAPFALAQAGYAVVATDYAGLGVPYYPDGSKIVHPYLANPAAGNDVLYAAQAAQAAFPATMSREFVVFGHSQGGGAAWAAAEQQVSARIPGYLGSIAAAPVIDNIASARDKNSSMGLLTTALGTVSILPEVRLSDVLTPLGEGFVNAIDEIGSCDSGFVTLLSGLSSAADIPPKFAKDDFLHSDAADKISALTRVGGTKFAGPMLVFHGTEDEVLDEKATHEAVRRTCEMCPDSELEYVRVQGLGHNPVMMGAQQLWMEWIDERFEKGPHKNECGGRGRCTFGEYGGLTPRPLDEYQGNADYILFYAQDDYLKS